MAEVKKKYGTGPANELNQDYKSMEDWPDQS
jgi:hypothetical protein